MLGSESTSESPVASTSKKEETSTDFFILSISLSHKKEEAINVMIVCDFG
jgi:hypothetical protein